MNSRYRDRIKEMRRVRSDQLVPHPRNFRLHPDAQQNALRGVLTEVGWADTLKVRELPDGRFQIIDGHLRQGMDETVPVLVLDLNDEETLKILMSMDPIAAMAETSNAALESLMADVRFDEAATQKMLDELAANVGLLPPAFAPVGADEQSRLDEKSKTTCPQCGHEF